MDAVGDILSALAELAIWLLELLFYVIENLVCGVVWLFKNSRHYPGMPRWRKVPERTRFFIRSCMHSTLALGLLFLVIYVGFMRKPAKASGPQTSSPSPPTKIEQARKVLDKAKQIKETLLPPQPQP